MLQVNSNPVISPVLQLGSTSETIQVNAAVTIFGFAYVGILGGFAGLLLIFPDGVGMIIGLVLFFTGIIGSFIWPFIVVALYAIGAILAPGPSSYDLTSTSFDPNDVRQALQMPAVANRFRELGVEPSGASGDAFNDIVRRDYERWGEIIRRNNLRAD